MVLEHIAAILLFSGPPFHVGSWMVIDPAVSYAFLKCFSGASESWCRGWVDRIFTPNPAVRVYRLP